GVDEYKIGQRVTVEIHAGCGQCKRCREGMYTSCHNYGLNYGDVDKGHRANGFTTDGGFCEYQVNNINTLIAIPDAMSDEEATLVATAGTAMYGLTELGGLVAGESVVVTGPGPIGLLGVAVAKALGAQPVILTGTRDNRLQIGRELGADHVINVRNENVVEAVKRLNGGKGVDYVIECSGAPNAVNEAGYMVNRRGQGCLAAFPHAETPVDVAHIVRNNIYLYGIRGEGKSATHRAEAFLSQKRFDATKIHTHTFALDDLPTAIRYAKDRVDDAIKVVVKARGVAAHRVAAEQTGHIFRIRNVSSFLSLRLSSSLSPVWRSRFGISIPESGSVHSTIRMSPGCDWLSALRVRSAGSGHLRPRRLSVFSVIGCDS